MRNTIPSVVLKPKKSRQLTVWVLILHVTTVLLILAVPLLPQYKIPLVITLLWISYARIKGYRINRYRHVVEAKIRHTGHANIVLADGERVRARLRTDSLMTPWVVLLRFDVKNRWRHPVMLLFRDALADDVMRRLRILLKHGSFHQ